MSQITAFDQTTGQYVEGVGDSVNKAVRVSLVYPNPQSITIFTSTPRATTLTTSPTFTNLGYGSIIFYWNITAVSGTGGLTFRLNYIDPLSGVATPTVVGSQRTATGMYTMEIGPTSGLATLSGGSLTSFIPYQWAVSIVGGDASSYTYSLSADLIPFA